jgi:hypothetical protein
VRAASVKYACGSGSLNLETLSQKIEHLFNNNFPRLAVKNKSKSQEDDKAFRTADRCFDEYADSFKQVFAYFGKNGDRLRGGKHDNTIQIE